MKIRAILALAVSAVLLLACKSKDDFVQSPLEGNDGQRGLLTLGASGASLDMNHGGETYDSIYFTADEAWRLQNLPQWATIEEVNGSSSAFGHIGTSHLRLQVRPNLTKEDRSVVVKMVGNSTGKELSSLTITQPKVVFELADKHDPELSFEWYEFQLKDKDVYRKSFDIKTNVTVYSTSSSGFYQQFDHTIEFSLPDVARVSVVPLKPGIGAQDIAATVSYSPNFGNFELTGDEKIEIANKWTFTFPVSQECFYFDFGWKDGSAPVFNELGSGRSGESYVFTVKSDKNWMVSAVDDWLKLDVADGELQTGRMIPGSDEPVEIAVSARWANPSLKARPFTVELYPTVDDEVLQRLPSETREQIRATIGGSQKALVMDVTAGGKSFSTYGYSFENEEIGVDEHQLYEVKVKTSAAFADFCSFNEKYDWVDYSIDPEPETFPADSTYTLVFSLQQQNLDWDEISTSGNGKSLALKPEATLFADASKAPSVPFLFSQNPFVFDIDWSSKLEAILCKSTRKTDVNVTSSGHWDYEVVYNSDNDADKRDWVSEVGENNIKGDRTLHFGSNSANPYEHSRSARVIFTSLNHKTADGVLKGGRKEFLICQNDYRFVVREREAQTSPALTDFGSLPAFQTAEDEVALYLECSDTWEITHCPAFLEPSVSKCTDEDGYSDWVHFTVKPNIAKQAIPADQLVFKAGNGGTRSVSASQDAFVFDFNKLMSTVKPYNDAAQVLASLTLTRGVKWQVTDKDTQAVVMGNNTGSGQMQNVAFIPDHNLASVARTLHYSVAVTEPEGVQPIDLNVQQSGFQFDFKKTSLHFGALPTSAETYSWDVTCSGPWQVKSGTTSGFRATAAGSKLTVSAEKNLNLQKRTGKLVLESIAHKNAGQTKEWTVNLDQDAFVWNNDAASNYNWNTLDSYSTFFDITSTGDWYIKNKGTGAEIKNGETVDGWSFSWGTVTSNKPTTINIQGSPNYSRSDRILDFALISREHEAAGRASDCTKDVNLSQKGYTFRWDDGASESTRVLSFGPLSTETKTLDIACSDVWTLENPADWVSVSWDENGHTVYFSVYPNTSLSSYSSDRTATLKFLSHGLELEARVGQSAYIFNADKSTIEINQEGTTKVTVNVRCSGQFTVTPNASWIKLNGAKEELTLNGNTYFEVSADAYETTSTDSRSGTILISSNNVGGLSLSPITVTQAGKSSTKSE